MSSLEARKKVMDIERLPAMPQVAVKLLDALANDRITPGELESIIQSDQALASKVLSLANSAYYGFAQQVTTIQRAVVAIGVRDLRLLSLGASLTGIFDPSSMPPEFDGDNMWLHCLTVSLTARHLANISGFARPGELLVAGLLHDLGKLVIGSYLKEEASFMAKQIADNVPFYEAELKLGLKHNLVGSWLAQKWGLPQIHFSAIKNHHSPKTSDPCYMSTCLVSLADLLAKESGLGAAHEARQLDRQQLLEVTGLSEEDMSNTMTWMTKEVPPVLDAWRNLN